MKEGDIFYSRILKCNLKLSNKTIFLRASNYYLVDCDLLKCRGCGLFSWCQGLKLKEALLVSDLGLDKEICSKNGNLIFDLPEGTDGEIFGELYNISQYDLNDSEKQELSKTFLAAWVLNRLNENRR